MLVAALQCYGGHAGRQEPLDRFFRSADHADGVELGGRHGGHRLAPAPWR